MRISILAIPLLLFSCATKTNYTFYKPEKKIEIIPKENTLSESELGDPVFTYFEGEEREVLILTNLPKIPYSKLSLDSINTEYLILKSNGSEKVYWNDTKLSIVTTNNSSYVAYMPYKGSDVKPIKGTEGILRYKLSNAIIPESESFKKEFIYNGRVDNYLKFIYREFYDDMARPSFTQEVQYDFNESDVIGFKGLRIKVINASNIEIEYKILEYENFIN